jgi:alpha-galactosidase
MNAFNILRSPDTVTAFTEETHHVLHSTSETATSLWSYQDIEVRLNPGDGRMPVEIMAPQQALLRVHLRWNNEVPEHWRFLGDHWERGYGDLEWRGLVPERVMPWYFLAHDGTATHGYGVETGPGSMCFWRVDGEGISLWLDVRCGGRGVCLGSRTLKAAAILYREGQADESPFAAARAFCRQMCPNPLMPKQPVYGGNDWYYAYGNNSYETIVRDAATIRELAPQTDNHPVMVIDDGWQICNRPVNGGPWHSGNRRFPAMYGLAAQMKSMQVRPGIWFRPLVTSEKVPDWWRFPAHRPTIEWGDRALDPSASEVLSLVSEDVRRLVAWGYEVIKHDFSTYDIFGRWGFAMGHEITDSNWSFADRSRTSAQIIRQLYVTLRDAAGEAILIGCNVIGHLAAGLVELQRTGDDTSGREWERTRKMGINTLAFRMAQHETFFAGDADCVGLTNEVPWHLNRQWLDLLARSGTPLFVSAAPDALGTEQKAALRDAFALAARPQPAGEPLDWMNSTCPRRWRFGRETMTYRWHEEL